MVQATSLPMKCRTALASVERLTSEPGAKAAIEVALTTEMAKLSKPTWSPGYCQAVAENFASKVASRTEGVQFGVETLVATGVQFEAFRISAFRNSGVAPKRYFGFLDEQGRSSDYERN